MNTFSIRVLFGALIVLAVVGTSTAAHAHHIQPVLMVIANQDFYYREYADARSTLEASGIRVVVAAGSRERAVAHGTDGGPVYPDVALTDVDARDYSAIVFVGGWGASSYQYAFEGTYNLARYQPDPRVAAAANELISRFVEQQKYVGAICHGVTVLAWARVDGVSPLAGRSVTAFAGGSPGFKLRGRTYADATVADRWHIEANGARMPLSASIGEPQTAADDVVVDGRIITAENYESARLFASVVARMVASAAAK